MKPGGEELNSVLISLLAMEGFEGFTEGDDSVTAYISPQDADLFTPEHVLAKMAALGTSITFQVTTVEERNWNDLWERNYDPVYVDREVQIRAPFHPELEGFTYNLIIEPKMSFGTGHHFTTRLMIRMLLNMDMQSRSVLDMGCGTGVLAILASLRGADPVTAIDIDPWAYENSVENASLNLNRDIEIMIGGAELLNGMRYDVILANINRNILLKDIPIYVQSLNVGGLLVLSGIMKADRKVIIEKAEENSLRETDSLEDGDWLAIRFEKRAGL